MANISVIVPVYKVEEFLSRCVDSILCQSYTDFELILVDDGSPDSCGQLCDDYARQDSRIHVIHQENGGLSAARNSGIDWVFANSSSRWLAFVDSDDWVHPDFLRVLYETAEKTLCKISACAFFQTNGEGIPLKQEITAQKLTADDYFCGNYHGGATPAACNKLYHISLFKHLRFPIGKLHEDEFTVYLALYEVGSIGVTDAGLYAYYCNEESITRREWSANRMDLLEAFEQQIAFAENTGRKRLLERVSEEYVFGIYEQLNAAQKVYWKELRRKLRGALKLARQNDSFHPGWKTLWVYEAAYPCKPLWWLLSRLHREEENS